MAHVVAEVVIAILAQAGAAVPIVVVTADDPEREPQPCERAGPLVGPPVLAHRERVPDGDRADESVCWWRGLWLPVVVWGVPSLDDE